VAGTGASVTVLVVAVAFGARPVAAVKVESWPVL
jgi:hypothetical protein